MPAVSAPTRWLLVSSECNASISTQSNTRCHGDLLLAHLECPDPDWGNPTYLTSDPLDDHDHDDDHPDKLRSMMLP